MSELASLTPDLIARAEPPAPAVPAARRVRLRDSWVRDLLIVIPILAFIIAIIELPLVIGSMAMCAHGNSVCASPATYFESSSAAISQAVAHTIVDGAAPAAIPSGAHSSNDVYYDRYLSPALKDPVHGWGTSHIVRRAEGTVCVDVTIDNIDMRTEVSPERQYGLGSGTCQP